MSEGFTSGFVKGVIGSRRRPDDDRDFEKCAADSSGLISALVGAGIGGGIGLASDAIRPADDDEDRKRRRLVSLLAGAALGGITGYGADRFAKSSPILFPGEESTVSRISSALDPSVSTLLMGGGLYYGLKPHVRRGGWIHEMIHPEAAEWMKVKIPSQLLEEHVLDPARRVSSVSTGNPSEIAQALYRYETTVGGGKRVLLGKLMNRLGLRKINPWDRRVRDVIHAEHGLGEAFRHQLDREIKNGLPSTYLDRMFPGRSSGEVKTILGRMGVRYDPGLVTGGRNAGAAAGAIRSKHGLGEGLGAAIARNLRKGSPRARAASALALLLGLGATGYKAYDYTH